MLEEAHKTFLIAEGLCSTCNEWIKVTPDFCWALHHHKHEGKKCKGAGYSSFNYRYRVETEEAAAKLAKMIAEDDGICLSGLGGGGHNMSCGDGSNCWKTRFMLAKALANFVLENSNQKKTDD